MYPGHCFKLYIWRVAQKAIVLYMFLHYKFVITTLIKVAPTCKPLTELYASIETISAPKYLKIMICNGVIPTLLLLLVECEIANTENKDHPQACLASNISSTQIKNIWQVQVGVYQFQAAHITFLNFKHVCGILNQLYLAICKLQRLNVPIPLTCTS